MLSEDYLDYDNWSNETEREARELRFNQEYKDVTKSSTGKNFGLYISCIFHIPIPPNSQFLGPGIVHKIGNPEIGIREFNNFPLNWLYQKS